MTTPNDYTARAFALSAAVRPEAARGLLEIGLDEPPRPIDGVLDRLAQRDGQVWLEDTLRRLPAELGGARALLDASVTIAQLEAMKERAKGLMSVADPDVRTRGIALYFLVVAAGLAHHGAVLSSRERSDVEAILGDLAPALEGEWRALAERAVRDECAD